LEKSRFLHAGFYCTHADVMQKFNIFTFHFAVILRFRSQHGRLPQTSMTTTEKDQLLTLRDEVMKELNLDGTLLPDEFARQVWFSIN